MEDEFRKSTIQLPPISSFKEKTYHLLKDQAKNERKLSIFSHSSGISLAETHIRNLQTRTGRQALRSYHFIYKNLETFNRKKREKQRVFKVPIKQMLNENIKVMPRKLGIFKYQGDQERVDLK